MTKKAPPKKVEKLAVKKETVRDLQVRPERGAAVKGGVKTYGCSPTLSPS